MSHPSSAPFQAEAFGGWRDAIKVVPTLGAFSLVACLAACVPQPAPQAAAPTRIDPRLTQPPASELLDHRRMMARLQRLEANRRVKLLSIGRSREGRDIPLVVITEPPFDAEQLAARARRLAAHKLTGDRLSNLSFEMADVTEALRDTRLPVMLAGASWGNEAAQVEGLVQAAEELASDVRPETAASLRNVVALFIPLMNPDGRERAIDEWRRTTLSTGSSGAGNALGFMMNRDFIHDTQPEPHAVITATMDWRPVVGLDMHEDMYTLGVAIPEVAFVPPFMKGLDVEEDPSTRAAIDRVGAAVARAWREAGFGVIYDHDGSPRFAPMPAPGTGQLNPVAGSSGRLEFLWTIHDIVGLITESGRTPGSQSWGDRVTQKKLAALAAVKAVGDDPAFFANAVSDRRSRQARTSLEKGEFLVIPHAQPRGADLAELRRLLAVHTVDVFTAASLQADVVPFGQGETALVRHALLAERSELNDLPTALGVSIVRSADLDAASIARFRTAALQLRRADGQIEPWPTQPPRSVKVGVYHGQGLDGPGAGELMFVLRWLGFDATALHTADVKKGQWQGVSAIVVPDGEPRDIVNGDDPQGAGRRAPWQAAEPAAGIEQQGLNEMARFVRNGGRLITIGRSAALAGDGYANLAALRMASGTETRPGIGQVSIRSASRAAWLLDGAPLASNGTSRAFLWAPPGPGASYLFRMVDEAEAAATFDGAITNPAEMSFVEPAMLDSARRWTAIGVAPAERGWVVLFAVSPTFRAQWRSTFPLLANAITRKPELTKRTSSSTHGSRRGGSNIPPSQ